MPRKHEGQWTTSGSARAHAEHGRHTIAHLRNGESVLVHGAAGGLASVYPAVAKALGASIVLGTVGLPSKRPVALELGYAEILAADRFVEEFKDRRIDIVIGLRRRPGTQRKPRHPGDPRTARGRRPLQHRARATDPGQ